MSEYDLRKSTASLGKLVPVLKDKHGNVIDGLHRLEWYPDWPVVVCDWIDTAEKLEAARLACNTNRRTVKPEELSMRITLLSKAGLKADQIEEMTGLCRTTIYKYMPQELKPKGEAISEGRREQVARATSVGEVSPSTDKTVKTQDTAIQETSIHKVAPKAFDAAEFVECERCHIKTSEPKQWHGHTLCTKHYEAAEINPIAYDKYFEYLERGKAKAAELKVTAPSTESWKDREARMHPQKSKMEEELLLILGSDETFRPVVTDRGYPIVTVTPDFVLTRHNLAVFVDGKEVHEHRQDRDKELRQKLSDRHGLKVLSVTYSANTEQEKQRIIQEIKEAIQ